MSEQIERILENAECAAQFEIKDSEMRDSLVRSIDNALRVQARAIVEECCRVVEQEATNLETLAADHPEDRDYRLVQAVATRRAAQAIYSAPAIQKLLEGGAEP